MNKIIVALDSLRPSDPAVSYAMDLCKNMDAQLVAVFLDDFTNTSYQSHQVLRNRFTIPEEVYNECIREDNRTRREAVLHFKEIAGSENVKYTIHHDRNISLNELIAESVYADLLVIENKETMTFYAENPPTHFLKNLLREVHCPVLVVPGAYRKINKVLFLYDGEPYSSTAIKMLSYLFPVFAEIQAEVVTVKSKKRDVHDLNNRLLREYMKSHFPHTVYTVLNGLADVEVVKYLKCKYENELIVIGSYHRSRLSRMMHPSMAESLMQEVKVPLFIDNN